MIGGRAVVNSVNYEDGDGPGSRIQQVMPIVKEHGAAVVALTIDEQGQARTAEWKVRVADRSCATSSTLGHAGGGHPRRLPDVSHRDGAGGDAPRRLETIDAIRELKRATPTCRPRSASPTSPSGSIRRPAWCSTPSSCTSAWRPGSTRPSCTRRRSCRWRASRTSSARPPSTWSTTGATTPGIYDPLARFLELFEGVDAEDLAKARADELPPSRSRNDFKRRIVDGERKGLEADLDEALRDRSALEIVNDTLLEGMKTVGDLFGRGEMQLPFVLQSAEVMKTAVAHLEPHMERSGDEGKGTIVLATVKGDVHDIGKNLVDIILSNNGYTVVNIGIKVPCREIIEQRRAPAPTPSA